MSLEWQTPSELYVCVLLLTDRSWQDGTAHRQVSSLDTLATHMQPGQRACNNTHPCTCSSRTEREEEGRQMDMCVRTAEESLPTLIGFYSLFQMSRIHHQLSSNHVL